MTGTGKTRAQELLGDTAPELVRLTDEVLFGQVWADPGLSPRDRSLVTGGHRRPRRGGWPSRAPCPDHCRALAVCHVAALSPLRRMSRPCSS